MTQFFLSVHREKKLTYFDLKSWVTGGTKIWPGKVNNWRIFESIWLSCVESIWLSCVEPIWLSTLSHLDSQCWVNLTLNVESIWLLRGSSQIVEFSLLFVRSYWNFHTICKIERKKNTFCSWTFFHLWPSFYISIYIYIYIQIYIYI